jgi:uncharacterized protein (TIGR02301 family)
MKRFAALALAAMTLTSPESAVGQQGRGSSQRAPPAPATPAPPPPPAEPPAAPYEKELLRLAEVIGSLAFLRSLCESPDATEWPRRMQALIDAEGTTPGRRERLAGAYNRGYRGFSLTYRICTPSATEAISRYIAEGELLSKNLAGRYGG